MIQNRDKLQGTTKTKVVPFLATCLLAAVLSGCGVSHTGDGVIGAGVLSAGTTDDE